ncbi:MAG: DNA primase [Candidatus Spechtbacterales bacterium]
MPGDNVEEIKQRLDIKDVVGEYVKLEKAGVNLKARCPFHNEKTPSFFVSPARQVWRCFGCSLGGDHFTFVQEIEGVEFPEALRILAEKAGVALTRQDPRVRSEKNRSVEVCAAAAKYFQGQMASKNGQLVAEYLMSRGVSDESIKNFRIGYAPIRGTSLPAFLHERGYGFNEIEKAGLAFKSDRTGDYISRFRGRVMFPITNHNGDVVGFGGRRLSDELAQKMGRDVPEDSAKYINSPQTNIYDKSRILYGFDRAKMAIRKEDACLIVEGYMDVILAHQAGSTNTVAASGTSLTEHQLNVLGRFTKSVLASFDMDAAGESATKRSIDLARSMGFDVRVIQLPEGSDPADVIAKDPKAWERAVAKAQSVVAFYYERAFATHNSASPEGKRSIGAMLAPVLKNIPSRIEAAHWVQKLAEELHVSQEDVWEEVRSAKTEGPRPAHFGDRPMTRPQLVPRKDLLAAQIVLYILKNPALAGVVGTQFSRVKDESPAFGVITALSRQPATKVSFAGDQQALVDQVLFEADVRGQTEFSEKDFVPLLVSYKRELLQSELRGLEQTIRENEAAGKSAANEKLFKRVQKRTEELHTLNSTVS